jgi:uncharacterized protein (DUF433 family)
MNCGLRIEEHVCLLIRNPHSAIFSRPSAKLTPSNEEEIMLTTTKKELNIDGLIWTDPERMSGTPCFDKTRVPVKTLFDYLENGGTLEEFLLDFEGVTREQAVGVLELARRGLLEERSAA